MEGFRFIEYLIIRIVNCNLSLYNYAKNAKYFHSIIANNLII